MSLLAVWMTVHLGGDPASVDAAPMELDFVEFTTAGAAPDATLPLIVVLPGRGGSPERFAERFHKFDVPARVVVLQGPYRNGAGFAWFDAPMRTLDEAGLEQRIDEDISRVVATVERVRRERAIRGEVVLAGYSQGGTVALATGLRHPELAGGVVVASSWLPESLAELPEGRAPEVSFVHGGQDRRLPLRDVRKLHANLQQAGLTSSLRELPNGEHRLRGRAEGVFMHRLRQAVSEP